MQREGNAVVDEECHCGRGLKRSTQCSDCVDYPTTCPECFIDYHKHSPYHWARVWDPERRFFSRTDISMLREGGYAINLGHCGTECPLQRNPIIMTIVHTNGIHTTKVHFCDCPGYQNDRVQQLMRAQLFPGTGKRPTTAYTFAVMKQYELLRNQGKLSAYDYSYVLMCKNLHE